VGDCLVRRPFLKPRRSLNTSNKVSFIGCDTRKCSNAYATVVKHHGNPINSKGVKRNVVQ
jgi:hypothetical protein